MNAQYLKSKYEAGLDWEAYLATDPEKAARWREFLDGAALSGEQRRLVEAFVRPVKMLCVSGIWCGDCVQQVPLLHRIAEAADALELRMLDRDEHPDLRDRLRINAGTRVPVVIFMAEDYEPVSVFGDRSLTRYRAMAQKQLGGACPLPGAEVPADEVAGTLQDWLDEVERVHLLLRLSGRLRQKHGD